jgi:hypothetical protein
MPSPSHPLHRSDYTSRVYEAPHCEVTQLPNISFLLSRNIPLGTQVHQIIFKNSIPSWKWTLHFLCTNLPRTIARTYTLRRASSLTCQLAVYTGYPRGKVNILGGHNIDHYKQKSVYVHVSYSERFPR